MVSFCKDWNVLRGSYALDYSIILLEIQAQLYFILIPKKLVAHFIEIEEVSSMYQEV